MSFTERLQGIMAVAAYMIDAVKVVAPKDRELALRFVESARAQLHRELHALSSDEEGTPDELLTRSAHSALDRLLDAATTAADAASAPVSESRVLN